MMIFLVFLVHAIFAAIFPLGRVANQVSSPLFFTAVRMLLGGGVLLFYTYRQYGSIIPRIRNGLWVIIGFAITGIYITNAFEFWALQYLPAAKTSFIYSLSPFAAAILSYFLFQERMTPKKLLGMAIGLVGFAIMIVHHSPGETGDLSVGYLSAAEGAVIIAAIASSAGWILLRRTIRYRKIAILIEVLGLSMVIGGAFCLFQSFLVELWNPIPVFDYSYFIVTLLLATLCSNWVAYPLYTELLKTYTATFLSFAGFIEPLCAALYGWIFLNEVVTIYFVYASILVFIGLYLFYMEELRQGYIVKKR
jgi:drug/metabolite transporter (DMT)-like permease